ncbi:hypothetical protein X801_06476 [Opisthorchis viverrini]|uniref:Uncharacterized protein n=2 Tax=Opisthorchis viverrini TaxID=6198 RepID=A0A074ZD72_OPIVI|nr:hypothetical protein T265_08543 [Opisthorchis viverrini]KER23602.1 hypothetical protein T265_08543 [Opisthorchis viverrini]OON17682.1 hypothetical protein X801_06476 [Opisthorchis viverrini]
MTKTWHLQFIFRVKCGTRGLCAMDWVPEFRSNYAVHVRLRRPEFVRTKEREKRLGEFLYFV